MAFRCKRKIRDENSRRKLIFNNNPLIQFFIHSTGSQHMDEIKELEKAGKGEEKNVAYKIAMLGDTNVGKTTLTYQFTTSEYICAYDLSLDDDYGQKTVSVLLNNQETDLEVIDHPACEMSVSRNYSSVFIN